MDFTPLLRSALKAFPVCVGSRSVGKIKEL